MAITYLSPSSLNVWRTSRDEFYLKYLSPNKPPRLLQTQPMSVGSSLDAYVKAYLNQKVLGGPNIFDALFTEQVEPHNRDWALVNGAVVYRAYRDSGCLDILVQLLEKSTEICLTFPKYQSVLYNGVPLCGVPDLSFRYSGIKILLDWKVNGYCSKNGASLKRGHFRHGDCLPEYHDNLLINGINHLEEVEPKWAEQLSVYDWISGGSDFIGIIEQIAYGPKGPAFGSHRCRVSQTFQTGLYTAFQSLWSIVQSSYIYRDLSVEASAEHCLTLDRRASLYGDEQSDWLMKGARNPFG